MQVTRHDIGDKAKVGTVSEAYPHLIFEGFTSKLGQRVANILKYLFPTPKDDSRRVLTFVNSQASLRLACALQAVQLIISCVRLSMRLLGVCLSAASMLTST